MLGDAAHPAQGQTKPDKDMRDAACSWCKAFRLVGQTWETGALARQVIERHPLALALRGTGGLGRGTCATVFVTTAGGRVIPAGLDMAAGKVRPGDAATVNHLLGVHGAAIMAACGDMALSTDLVSDCASLGHLMQAVLAAAPNVRAARDATRGGLATALNDIAGAAHCGVMLDEAALPLNAEVRGVGETLDLDPLYLANEGKLVLFLPEGSGAAIIGQAVDDHAVQVRMRTNFGGVRIVDMLIGEQLPRVCQGRNHWGCQSYVLVYDA